MNSQTPERIRAKIENSKKRFIASYAIGSYAAAIKLIPGVRGSLPEPWNIGDHIGNFHGSTVAGYLGALAVTRLFAKEGVVDGSEKGAEWRLRIKMAIGAAASGSVFNLIAENKAAMSAIDVGNTVDPIDFAYGLIAATIVGTILPKIHTEYEDGFEPYESSESIDINHENEIHITRIQATEL